jgi:hypothetical protein
MILFNTEKAAKKKIKSLISCDFEDVYDESSFVFDKYEISFNLKFDLEDWDNLVYLHEIVTAIEKGLNICVDSIQRLSIDFENNIEIFRVLFSTTNEQ